MKENELIYVYTGFSKTCRPCEHAKEVFPKLLKTHGIGTAFRPYTKMIEDERERYKKSVPYIFLDIGEDTYTYNGILTEENVKRWIDKIHEDRLHKD